MKRKRKKKAPGARSSAPVLPADKMPGKAGSRRPQSESRPAGLDGRWQILGVCVFLATIIWAVFGRTLHYGFVNYDDDLYVYENPEVARGLTSNGILWAFTHVYAANWHPLTWMSLMLDGQFHGLNAGGYHLTNILLHTLAAILLLLVLRQMTGSLWRSAFVAAVFAIHPLRVESVAWVAERKDVLSGVFFMLTLGAYVHYARRSWSAGRYGLVVLLFALGLMSKPMLVTLPFVLLLLDWWPLNRMRADAARQPVFRLDGWLIPRRVILEKLPLLGLVAASCAATLFAQTEAVESLEDVSMPLRVANALVSCVAYIGGMFWPSRLAIFYPFPPKVELMREMIPAAILLLFISGGVFVLRKTRPYLLVGWLWYLVMLVPVIGILQVGSQARADRYTYLPQIGLYVLVAWSAAELCAGWRHRRVLLGGCSMAILAALIFCARAQTSYWRSSESLWTHALACTTSNVFAENNLGAELLQKGAVDEAIAHLQKASQINPDDALACYNLGNALLRKGNVDEAIAHYQKALQINPDYAHAHYSLGNALFKKGNVGEAISHYQKALQINPDYADAENNLGNALRQKGSVDEAISYYQKALQTNPDSAQAHNNLGIALFQKGGADEAIAHFQKALEIDPDNAEGHYNLGCALLQKGKVDEAIAHLQRAVQINPGYAQAHNNLANALLQKGRVDEAIAHYQKTLQISPDYAEAQINLAQVLATCPQASLRNGKRAVELARRANQLTGDRIPVYLGTLAAAYAEAGRFPEAVETAQRALQLAEAQSNPALADSLRSQMRLYQAGLPFHLQ
jgi:tetratricopeptide (TPR) repeat protein